MTQDNTKNGVTLNEMLQTLKDKTADGVNWSHLFYMRNGRYPDSKELQEWEKTWDFNLYEGHIKREDIDND